MQIKNQPFILYIITRAYNAKSKPGCQKAMKETRQKGLQSNSGPMCAFVFVCWHCREAMQTGYQRNHHHHHQATVVSC